MSNQDKQQPANQAGATPASAVADTTTTKLERLLELLLAKESISLEREANERTRQKNRDVMYAKNEAQNAFNLLKLQSKCKHMKGIGKKTGRYEAQHAERVRDFNVTLHTFIDGTAVIKCLQCGAKWKQSDTPEFLVRNGKKIPNVTKIGWEQALAMVAASSNRPTSSEVPTQFARGGSAPEDFVVPEGFEY